MKPEIKGLLIAPAVPSLPFVALGFVFQNPSGAMWYIIFTLPIAYITAVLIGFPVHFLLTRLKLIKLFYYILAGIVASVAPYSFYVNYLSFFGFESISHSMRDPMLGIMALAGGLVATTFWLIARPDRPE